MAVPMLEAALRYVARGWPVLPCSYKRPLTSHGVKDATLDPDQVHEWWQRWPNANVAIACGHGLTVADIDDLRALDALTWLATCDTARVSTSRGQHCYFSGELPTCTPYPGLDVRGSGAYVLAPPSVHPSGSVYAWLADRDPAPLPPELVALVGERAQATQSQERRRHLVRLPRLARRILRADPETIARYATRSESDRALLVSLANAGASLELAKAIYLRSAHARHLDPGARDFDRRFAAEWQRARERASQDTPTVAAVRRQAVAVSEWAMNTPWLVSGNRTAQESARRVLLAHCERALLAGADTWQLSVRDMAMAARTSLFTAWRANKRLVRAGLVRCVKPGYRDMAATWTFGRVRKVEHLRTSAPVVRKCSTLCTDAPGDAFEHRALGRTIWRTFDTLGRLESATLPELTQAAGWTERTTRRHVLTLAAHGLIAPLEDGRWAVVPGETRLTEVGRALGGSRQAAQRAEVVRLQRAAHRARLQAADAPDRAL